MTETAVFLATFGLYLATVAPTITSGDTPELFAAAFNLDVTHPPGYPLLAMLVRLSFLLPAGSLMFRAGVLSAAAGAGCCALSAGCVRALGGSRGPAVLTALLLAVQPLLWWQSTMLEKYSLQMFLASLALRVMLSGRPGLLHPAFACALALAHHSLAVFLGPMFVWRLLRERRTAAGWTRVTLLAAVLALLPGSIRFMYPAVRAEAVAAGERAGTVAAPTPYMNWGEPFTFPALYDYLRLKYYSSRFTNVNLARANFVDHLSYYPRHLTWPGLAAGLAGLVLLCLRSPGLGAGFAATLLVSFAFNLRFVLPPALADVYHQDGFLVFALCAGVAAGELRLLVSRWRGARTAFAAAAAAGLACWAGARLPVLDAGRHFFAHDYLLASISLTPRGGVFMAGFDADRFGLRYFQSALGIRRDLVSFPLPHKVMPGHFVVRRRFLPWAAATLPGARLGFTDEDDGFTILRRLVRDNSARYCFAVCGLSEPVVPDDLFRRRAFVFLSRAASCGKGDGAAGLARAWRAVRSRTWFSPAAVLGPHRTVMDITLHDMRRSAEEYAMGGRPDLAERMLEEALRIAPRVGAVWASLGALHASRGKAAAAAEELRRAIEFEPSAPEHYESFLKLMLAYGSPSQTALFLRDVLSRPPLSRAPSAPAAARALAGGELAQALPVARRVLAETALRQAEETPGNPEYVVRRNFLYEFASFEAPDWAEARRRCGLWFLATGAVPRALPHLRRAVALNPADLPTSLNLGMALITEGEYAEAAEILESLLRRDPSAAPALFYLGQAELGRGRRDAAARAFERYLALSPASPNAPLVRRVLDTLRARK